MKALRIGIDARGLQPGHFGHLGRGIGAYAEELVRALARLDDTTVVLHFDPALPVDAERLPAKVERAWFGRIPRPFPLRGRVVTQVGVRSALRRGDLDVFHFLSLGDAPLRPPAHAVITVHDLILEVLWHFYAPSKPLRYRMARWLERRTLEGARVLVADSETSKQDIVRLTHVEPERVHVTTLGVDGRFRPPREDAVRELRVRLELPERFALYLGGIDARKNVPGLLRALARVHARAPLPLVIAGPAPQEPEFPALMAEARRLGLEPSVRVLGYVAVPDLPVLLGAATLFAFPSVYEGFGLPPLEAMACGTPVVSSDGGSLREVLGEGALLVRAGDEAALAEAMQRVAADADLRAALRERGLKRAAGYTWDATARATRAAYEHAARGARP